MYSIPNGYCTFSNNLKTATCQQMKYLLLLIILTTCISNKELKYTEEAIESQLCPQDGNCSYEVLKNQRITYNYSNLSKFYPSFSKGNKHVFKFEYKRNNSPNIQDSSYREEVFIELDTNNLEIETTVFKGQKIIFARWCYCKGQTGYYKIEKGKLSVKKIKKNTYQLKFTFKMDQVPQVITEINHVFSLE